MTVQIVEENVGLLGSFGLILYALSVDLEFIRRKLTDGRKMVLPKVYGVAIIFMDLRYYIPL